MIAAHAEHAVGDDDGARAGLRQRRELAVQLVVVEVA